MTGTYQPRGRVYARHGIDDEVLAPGILTEGLIGRPGILSYFGPFDATIKEETASPERVFALDFDADPLFMKQRRARFSGVDLGTDPDTGDAMAPGALSDGLIYRPRILSHKEWFGDTVEQDGAPPDPIFTSNLDANEPAFMDLWRTRFSDADLHIDPDTGDAMGPGVLTEARTARPESPSDQEPPDDTTGQEPIVLPPIRVSNIDEDEPAMAFALHGSGQLGRGAGTVLRRSRDVSYETPAYDAEERKTKSPKVPSAWLGIGDIGHADGLESLIPFWGAGRNALADLQEGNYASPSYSRNGSNWAGGSSVTD